MNTLGSYVRKHWATYTMATVFMLIAIALDMMFPKVTERIVNEVLVGNDYTYFPYLLLAIILIGIGRSVFGYYKEFTFDKNCITIGTEMRKDLFDHIQSLSLDYFDDSSTGELMARVKDDIDKIYQLVGMVAMRGMEVTLNSVLIIYFMFSINVPLTFLPLTFMIICGATAIIMEKKLDKVYDAISEENAEMTTTAEENLAGVRTVKAFARENYEIKKFFKHNKKYYDLNMEEARALIKFYPVFMLAGTLLPVAVAVLGGIAVINGHMNLGSLTAFIIYTRNCTWPMEELGWITNEFSSSLASMKKIKKIYAEHSTLSVNPAPVHVNDVKGEIEFENVSLELGGKEVLSDISFSLKAGKTLGIMGQTGSGKSTIINLIQRFYDPTGGSIKLDGTEIRDMELEQVRSATAVVMQDVFLFSDTIEENIRMGRKDDMTMDEIKSAAKMAKASDFIEKLEDSYETVIGERGVGLSGGQKQRISIARAISKNAPILILDDSTSALDMETESEIQKTLDEIKSTTRVIVAHRISAVRNADEIIYLQDGKIAERGTHEQLLKKKGLYYETYIAQYGVPMEMEVSA
ncbi:ABC transporter ATP-binding/permease protein [Butyrivibrio proteoclasticus B316]|uniref:ABC transporter ATP-binding/permease protein n=1 Tax=Butyrivibrio proteoclasticus (strain ATCC 51982 / DSM 14932 / B316) TaxID=515622 RepID=E0S2E2_BUTPB|nr:ABC transporter ATP-binding protein [Butyrivibrio proteoclasticus]ADL32765.1 ABC transporter ATP-binding/permease protein [Butyrivibrio proteoclasticus B316]